MCAFIFKYYHSSVVILNLNTHVIYILVDCITSNIFKKFFLLWILSTFEIRSYNLKLDHILIFSTFSMFASVHHQIGLACLIYSIINDNSLQDLILVLYVNSFLSLQCWYDIDVERLSVRIGFISRHLTISNSKGPTVLSEM